MIGVALAAAVAGWLLAAYFLWRSVVPDGLRLPDVDETSLFPSSTLSAAEHYERFVRWDFVAAELPRTWAPGTVVTRDDLPRLASGKVDRQRLALDLAVRT